MTKVLNIIKVIYSNLTNNILLHFAVEFSTWIGKWNIIKRKNFYAVRKIIKCKGTPQSERQSFTSYASIRISTSTIYIEGKNKEPSKQLMKILKSVLCLWTDSSQIRNKNVYEIYNKLSILQNFFFKKSRYFFLSQREWLT